MEEQQKEVEVVENVYLISFLEAEGERHISVKATNILTALAKFAGQYQEICGDWEGISLNVELIETIE